MSVKIFINGKEASVKPNVPFIVDRRVFAVCSSCGRIIRMDGIMKGIHFCK